MRRFCKNALRVAVVIAALGLLVTAGARAGEPPRDSLQVLADSLAGVPVSCRDVATGLDFSIRAQRVLLAGSLDGEWSPDSSGVCLGSGSGLRSFVAPDGEGGAFVGWVDSKHVDADIYLQRFTADGVRASGWPEAGLAVCAVERSQYQLSISEDGEGGVYLAWTDYRGGVAGDIYATRVDGSGEVHEGWPSGGVPVCVDRAEQSVPQILGRGGDGALLVWVDRRAGAPEIYGQMLTPTGEIAAGWLAGGSRLAPTDTDALEPRLAADSSGNGVLLWRRESGGVSLRAVSLLGLSPGGTGLGFPVDLASDAEDLGTVGLARTGAHGMLVAWSERRDGAGAVRVQKIDLTGSVSLAWTVGGALVRAGAVGTNAPAVLADGHGGAFVAWEDYRSGGQGDIYMSRVDGSGERVEEWPESGLAVATGTRGQFEPALVAASDGAAIATWVDEEEGTSGMFLRSRRVLSAAPKLLRTLARPGHVSLTWKVGAADGVEFRILRNVGEEEWTDLTGASPNDSSQLVVHDRGVAEGAHVEYRVLSRSGDVEAYSEPVAIDVPVAPLRLALGSAWARPRMNAIMVSLALPRGPALVLDLIDVTGRRAARERIEGLEPGEHTLTFRVPSQLASGVYFLRVVQGKDARSTKVIYVR